MSQDQPRRSETDDDQPLRYGDVFDVRGDLAGQAIAPKDAAMMQSAEAVVLGQTQKGGPASVMQFASRRNERLLGGVGREQASDVVGNQGVMVTETVIPGGRIVTEFVAGQPVGQFTETDHHAPRHHAPEGTKITVGEALEATALTAGDKVVEKSDAAAIQAAEARAIGTNVTLPGGIAAQALSAVELNAGESVDENKTKLHNILQDAMAKMPGDKAVDSEDAARIVRAEISNRADMTARPSGVAASVAAAARLNQERQ